MTEWKTDDFLMIEEMIDYDKKELDNLIEDRDDKSIIMNDLNLENQDFNLLMSTTDIKNDHETKILRNSNPDRNRNCPSKQSFFQKKQVPKMPPGLNQLSSLSDSSEFEEGPVSNQVECNFPNYHTVSNFETLLAQSKNPQTGYPDQKERTSRTNTWIFLTSCKHPPSQSKH
jgi:hypothetical protein